MSWTERFLRRNLKIAEERGTVDQRGDMSDLIAINSQMLGELGDVLGGKRNQKDHPHHSVNDLVNGVVANVGVIIELRREINGEN